MSYRDEFESERPTVLGCLPGCVIALVFGLPAFLVAAISECVDDAGRIGACPHKGFSLLAVIAASLVAFAVVSFVFTRLIDRSLRDKRLPMWGYPAIAVFLGLIASGIYAWWA